MMKKCPFCGSPAVPWPDNASDYVRGYHLCEHHMNFAVKYATKKTYNQEIVDRENKRVAYEEAFYAAIDDCAAKLKPDFENNCEEDPVLWDVYWSCIESLHKKPDYGVPISESLDDVLVDQWVAVRIKDLARRGDRNKRCTGHKESSPDSRCINYTSSPTGLCDECTKMKRSSVLESGMFDALEKAMEIMRNA